MRVFGFGGPCGARRRDGRAVFGRTWAQHAWQTPMSFHVRRGVCELRLFGPPREKLIGRFGEALRPSPFKLTPKNAWELLAFSGPRGRLAQDMRSWCKAQLRLTR